MSSIGAGDGNSNEQQRPDVLLMSEIEAFVKDMQPSTFKELGSMNWIEKHSRIEQLTIQAVTEAMSNREEFVKEMIVTHEKLTVLVHDVILVELWRQQILPILLKVKAKVIEVPTPCSFTIYTILFHEATCVNLIETILFHPESAQLLEDDALDLIDYGIRTIQHLLLSQEEIESTDEGDGGGNTASSIDLKVMGEHEFERQSNNLVTKIAFKCIAIVRYLIENIEKINSAVVPRLIISADTPMLLTELLLKKPWLRTTSKGIDQQYSDEQSNWIPIKPSERIVACKIEMQVWLAIYQIFLSPRVISTYEIHNYRRRQLLQLSGLLNEVILDQLPILCEFQRWLHELSMGANFGPTKAPLLLEMFPKYRTQLENQLKDKDTKDSILEIHKYELLNYNKDDLTEKAKKLASIYDMSAFESALPPSKCANCGQPALKRCSRCHFEYYCNRECQVCHWPQHKKTCDSVVSQFNKDNSDFH